MKFVYFSLFGSQGTREPMKSQGAPLVTRLIAALHVDTGPACRDLQTVHILGNINCNYCPAPLKVKIELQCNGIA